MGCNQIVSFLVFEVGHQGLGDSLRSWGSSDLHCVPANTRLVAGLTVCEGLCHRHSTSLLYVTTKSSR